jgi:hypothetical protein
VLALFVLLQGTVGMVGSTARALGEEIGWRKRGVVEGVTAAE